MPLLGVGNHVDHQVTRLAAEKAVGDKLLFYEDYPYAIAPGAVELIVNEKPVTWRSQIIHIPEEVLSVKIKAIAAYVSQLSTFFLDLSDLDHQVRQFNRTVGGERIWHRASSFEPGQRSVP